MLKHCFCFRNLLLLALLVLLCVSASAQQGTIQFSQTGNMTGITYTVSKLSGQAPSGAALLKCVLTYPSGRGEWLQDGNSSWNNGTASYTWNIITNDRGTYQVQCFWQPNINSRMASAKAAFTR